MHHDILMPLEPLLPSIVSDWLEGVDLEKLLEHEQALHFVFPQVFAQNIARLLGLFSNKRTAAKIFFPLKPTHSSVILRTAYELWIWVDVASVEELRKVLSFGFTGERIVATGPKSDVFLEEVLAHDALVQVNSLDELERIAQTNLPARISLRFSGFSHLPKSRFWIPLQNFKKTQSILVNMRDRVRELSVAFHLDSVSIDDRIIAARELRNIINLLIRNDFPIRYLDIGGGLGANIFAEPGSLPMFFASQGYAESPVWSRHADSAARDAFAHSVLSRKLDQNIGLDSLDEFLGSEMMRFLEDNFIELIVSPGRALLEWVWCSVAKIIEVEELETDISRLTLAIDQYSLGGSEQPGFVLPRLFPLRKSPESPKHRSYLFGQLCLEWDLLYPFSIQTSFSPRRGDCCMFFDTAAYKADFYAGTPILHPRPKRIAVTTWPNSFHYQSDE